MLDQRSRSLHAWTYIICKTTMSIFDIVLYIIIYD